MSNSEMNISRIEQEAKDNPDDYFVAPRTGEEYQTSVAISRERIEFILHYLEQTGGDAIQVYCHNGNYGDGHNVGSAIGVKLKFMDKEIIPFPFRYSDF